MYSYLHDVGEKCPVTKKALRKTKSRFNVSSVTSSGHISALQGSLIKTLNQKFIFIHIFKTLKMMQMTHKQAYTQIKLN